MAQKTSGVVRFVRYLLVTAMTLAIGFGVGSIVARISRRAEPGNPPSPISAPAPAEAAPSPSGSVASGLPYAPWDEIQAPNYYLVRGQAQVSDQPTTGTAIYGPLDDLGRTTGAKATVTYESMQNGLARERAEMTSQEPSGWGHNQEVDMAMPDGRVYHGFLFNRSHLIAKSLGGDDETHNLIMGTRTQNVGANVAGTDGGMAYAEGLARTWLDQHHDGTLYYAATPVYEGNELVARSVMVDIKSSDGAIDQRVEVFNAARGFDIDYATGTFVVTEDAYLAAQEIASSLGVAADVADEEGTSGTDASAAQDPVVPTGSAEAEDGERKVIVTGSGKAYHHDESCRGLANARSMEWVTVSEAERMGRHPCGICGG